MQLHSVSVTFIPSTLTFSHGNLQPLSHRRDNRIMAKGVVIMGSTRNINAE